MALTASFCYGSAAGADDGDCDVCRCRSCGDEVEVIRGLACEHRPETWVCPSDALLFGALAMLGHIDVCAEWLPLSRLN
jgi:hypothetical protein